MNIILASTSTLFGGNYLEYLSNEITELFHGIDEIIFIPFARPGGISHDDYTQKAREFFATINIKVKGLHEFEDQKEALNQAKGFFTGGGNTFLLVKELHEKNLMQLLKENIEQGKSYLGCSAGSIALLTVVLILSITVGLRASSSLMMSSSKAMIGRELFSRVPRTPVLAPCPDTTKDVPSWRINSQRMSVNLASLMYCCKNGECAYLFSRALRIFLTPLSILSDTYKAKSTAPKPGSLPPLSAIYKNKYSASRVVLAAPRCTMFAKY